MSFNKDGGDEAEFVEKPVPQEILDDTNHYRKEKAIRAWKQTQIQKKKEWETERARLAKEKSEEEAFHQRNAEMRKMFLS